MSKFKLGDMRLENIDWRKLKPMQGGLKILTDKNYSRLKKSFSEKGMFVPIFVWRKGDENLILDGHGRERLFTKEDAVFTKPDGTETTEIPCVVIDAKDEKDAKEKLLLITSQFQTITQEGLDEFAFDLDDGWVEDTTQFDALFDGDVEPEDVKDAEPQIDKAKELNKKWKVEKGDIWQIGDHRLLCGDSTKSEDVARVMDGDKATQIVTSPPYWVGMEYEYQKNQKDILEFIEAIVGAFMPSINIDNSRIVINTGCGRATAKTLDGKNDSETWLLLDWWRDALLKHNWKMRHVRVWVKDGGLPASIGAKTDIIDQHWEFIATFYNPDGLWRGVNMVDGPWVQKGYWDDIRGTARAEGHVDSFPIEIPIRILRLNGLKGEVVFEPFCGGGTTIVACQNLNRKCRSIEISPDYCAVILERMTEAFPDIEVKKI